VLLTGELIGRGPRARESECCQCCENSAPSFAPDLHRLHARTDPKWRDGNSPKLLAEPMLVPGTPATSRASSTQRNTQRNTQHSTQRNI
jgi:hypothetical protein